MPRDPLYRTLAASSKLVISSIPGHFRGLQSTVFGSREDFDAPSPPVHDSSGIIKTRDFEHFWPFSWAIVRGLWVPGGFRCPVTPGHDSSSIIKTHDFEHFWPFSWAIVHGFGVPGGFRCPVTPATRL